MGKRKEVYSPERTKRRELLTLLFIHRNVRGRFSDNLMGMKDLVNQYKPVSKQLVDMLKKEKGLTYAEAYVALELAYIQLKEESNFVKFKGGAERMEEKKDHNMENTDRRELLNLINGHRNTRSHFIDNLMGMKDLVSQSEPVSKQIVDILKREKGLTYTEAYVALELAYIQLKEESNFVQIQEVD